MRGGRGRESKHSPLLQPRAGLIYGEFDISPCDKGCHGESKAISMNPNQECHDDGEGGGNAIVGR